MNNSKKSFWPDGEPLFLKGGRKEIFFLYFMVMFSFYYFHRYALIAITAIFAIYAIALPGFIVQHSAFFIYVTHIVSTLFMVAIVYSEEINLFKRQHKDQYRKHFHMAVWLAAVLVLIPLFL